MVQNLEKTIDFFMGGLNITGYSTSQIDGKLVSKTITSQEWDLVTDEDLLQLTKDLKWAPVSTERFEDVLNIANRKLKDPVENRRFWNALGPFVRYKEAIGEAIRL